MALRRMAKSARVEDNLRALDIFYKHGILVQAGLILFDPNTTIQELRENLKWMLSYKWVVTKGVFSEMFAAEGTTFTRRLSTTGYVTQVMERTMNKSYDVLDERARTAYHALKYWQLSYGSIYDMTVDPLNAPKAIDIECRSKFHLLSIKLKERDLAFFSRVLDLVDANISLNELLSIAQETVHSSSSWISDFSEEVRSVYKDAQLPYNTQCNLFLASQQI
jgi:anaerobic magnesium-protoporphyrin IX monomethyl ester cyclase